MTHTVTLEKGLTVGTETHKVVTLREPTAGDLIEAMQESERVVAVNGGAELLISNNALSINTLRRQIVSIGEIKGPIELEMLKLLSVRDLQLLQIATEEMDLAASKEIEERGRSETASSGT